MREEEEEEEDTMKEEVEGWDGVEVVGLGWGWRWGGGWVRVKGFLMR